MGKYSGYISKITFLYNVTLKRILRYLKRKKKQGLRYSLLQNHKDRDLIRFTDFSHGNCVDIRRSTSCYIFFLYNEPVSRGSKHQATVATSIGKAEYISKCNAAKESIFLASSLKGLRYEGPDLNTGHFMDNNQAAIKLAINFIHRYRVKHIDI